MPTISKVRLCNIKYEGGLKRYNDDVFMPDGNNAVFVLENGGGKTVLVQVILQAVLPGTNHAERKIRETLMLDSDSAHVAVEWIINERPRRYLVTAVTLFVQNNKLKRHMYTYEYDENDKNTINDLPFKRKAHEGEEPATHQDMRDYYIEMKNKSSVAKVFDSLGDYSNFLENNYEITNSEWKSISKINSMEGGVEMFFEHCKTSSQLVNNLLIPTVEEGMSKESSDRFVKTFRAHQEHIKAYKVLKGDIVEHEKIKERVDQYVNVFSEYNKTFVEWKKEQSRIKGIDEFVNSEKVAINNKMDDHKLNRTRLDEDALRLKCKQSSLKIAFEEEERKECERILKLSNEAFQRENEYLEELEKDKNLLELKRVNGQLKGSDARIQFLNDELNVLEQSFEEDEIKNKYDLAKRKIKYKLDLELETSLGKKDNLKEQIASLKKEKSNLSKVIEETNKVIRKTEDDILGCEKLEEFNKSEVNKRKKKLLDYDSYQPLDDYRLSKVSRVETIENRLREIGQKKSLYDEQTSLIEKNKSRKLEDQLRLSKLISSLETDVNKIEQKMQELAKTYFDIMMKPMTIEGIYNRQSSITGELANNSARLEKEYQELMLQEAEMNFENQRYSGLEYFVGDRKIHDLVKVWKNEFYDIYTGIEFLAVHFPEKIDQLLKLNPLLANAMITTGKEKQKLMDKLETQRDNLMTPVSVFSLEDIESNVLGDMSVVFPMSWERMGQQEQFDDYKENLLKGLNDHKQAREIFDERVKLYKTLELTFNEFYKSWPREFYEKAKDDLLVKGREFVAVEKDLSEIENQLVSIKEWNLDLSKEVDQLNGEKNGLERYLEIIQDIKKYQNDLMKIRTDKYKLSDEASYQKDRLEELLKDYEQQESSLDRLDTNLSSVSEEVSEIESNSLYQSLYEVQGLENYESLEGLKVLYDEAAKVLDEGIKDRKSLNNDLSMERSKHKGLTGRLKSLMELGKFSDDLEIGEYPANGDQEETRLRRLIQNTRKDVDLLKSTKDKDQSALDKLKGSLDSLYKSHRDGGFSEVNAFNDPLNVVEEELKSEQNRIDYTKDELDKEWDTIEKDQKIIEKCIKLLIMKYDLYQLNQVNHSISVDESFLMEYRYGQVKTIQNHLNVSEQVRKACADQKNKLEQEARVFRTFCNNEIKHPKIKKLNLGAIESRKDYQDVLEWQRKIDEGIESAIRVMREALRSKDEKINKFIDRLYIHLHQVSIELGKISNKTALKIDGKSRKIYDIKIPPYEENQSKLVIREALEELTDKVGRLTEKDDDNESEVESLIEKTLSVKSLLHRIYLGKEIQIRVRKVTNDFKISSTLTGWNASNKWSGGEKWSKNMTLFLGIQNYIAERKFANLRSGKRLRVVLLDNPFGKASSDHVLEPVFKIADQLGFQLIAFTAHVEGKFISDYFPIVYSCRLRQATNRGVQLMTHEKEINYALLEELSPVSITRLSKEEEVQLSLFEF